MQRPRTRPSPLPQSSKGRAPRDDVCLLSVFCPFVCVLDCFFECRFCHGRQCSLQFLLIPVPL